MSTVETVNPGLTHFPMGRGNYLRRAGLPFVRLILAAVLLGGAVSQAVAQTTLDLSTYEMDTFSFTLTAPSSIKTFTITATDLTDDVIVSAPSQFEVSKNTTPADFQNSITFSPFESPLPGPTAVLVRMKAQTLPDSVSGEVINVSTYGGSLTGPITKTIALTGTLSGWTYAAWTNDADSGIDQNNYYTHKYALSGSGDVRVNGVTFTSLTGNYVSGKMSFQNIAGVAVDPTAAFTSQVAGSSAGLVSKYRTGDGSGGAMTINLSGLAINTRYELSLYSYSSSANERVLKFYSGTDEREIDTNLFSGTGVVAPFPDTTLLEYHGNGMRVIYNYTSDGEGNAQIKIDPATISGTLESFHLGALSNRQVAAAEGDFDYTTTGGKVTINAYIGTAGGVVVIPSTIGGNPVTAIGATAFASNVAGVRDEITQVIIPNTVLTIGAQAFENCIGLTTMKIPNSVTSIANNAFWGCIGLQSVEVGSGVTSIGSLAFYGCSSLLKVELPDSLTTIPAYGFSGCTSLASVYIGANVTRVEGAAFSGCSLLHDVYFAATTKPTVSGTAFPSIAGVKGYYYAGYAAAWSGATITGLALESYANPKEDFTYASEETCTIFTYIGTDPVVWIPPAIDGKSVAVIDEFAFIRKLQVTSVLIPPTVTEIRANAFYHCEALSSIVIPGSVVRVGSSAFSECYNLSRITLEPGVQEIGAFAFNASKPTTVTIPSSVNKIEGSAFRGVAGVLTLGLVNFEGRKPPADIDVLAFDGCAVGVVGQYYAGYSAGWSEASINLLSLQSSANPATDFDYTTTAGKVTITGYKGTSTMVMIPPTISGNPVTVITQVSGSTAFSLKSIRTLYLPDGLIEIGASTFKNCIGLTSLSLPESLTTIGASAFEGCAGLTSLKLVKNVTDLGGNSFKNCTGLTSIFFERSTPPTVESGAFAGTPLGARGYYYVGYSGWSTTSSLGGLTMVASSTAEADFFTKLEGGTVTILQYTGAGTFVMIPPTIGGVAVTAIGDGAFYEGVTKVTDVLLPDSVTSIGANAFRSQTLLSSIYLPDSVLIIKDSAFYGCTNLANVGLGSGLTTIENWAFGHCESLPSIIIPNTVTSLGLGSLSDCLALTSVTLGNQVPSLGNYTFTNDNNLTTITLPASVGSIGEQTFSHCTRLATVNFQGVTPPTVIADSFMDIASGAVGYYPAGAAGWSGVTITGLNLVSMPSGIFGTSFTVYWAPVVGATYTVQVSTTPLFVGVDIVKTVAATASETSKLITGLSVNTNYWYRVTATIPAGATTTSSSVPVTTGAADLPIPAAPVLSGLPATMVYQQKVVLAGAVSALQKTMSTPTAIPDYNGAAISQTMTIAGLTAGTNYQLNLGINVSAPVAGVLGDLQMYLQHTFVSGGVTMVDQTRMILDRVGVAPGDTVGSLATGLNVIMSDSGAFNIQSSDTPAHSATPLTGTWQTASLSGGTSFGLSTMGTKGDGSFNWNGDWTLVVADLHEGGTMQLDSWSMQLSDLSASDTSVGTAGLEYELVAPTSGLAKASILKNELEALSGTGTFDVRARYRAVDGVSQASAWTTKTIGLTKKEQIINIPALGTRSLAPKFMVGASSNSGLPLTYISSNLGTATIDGASGEITPRAVGTTTISAAQAGDENFSAATAVTQVLTIEGTPLYPAWGLSKLYSQDSTNSAVAGVTKGTNTYAYTKIEYAEASATAQIRTVPISSGPTQVANLTQTNVVAPGVIGYSSYSNPASFTSYSEAANAVPDGPYDFVGKNMSNAVVTNAVVNWSNNTNDYPVQAPQIGGAWVAQSLRLANPADPNTISWVAWTNTPVVGSTNLIRVEVTGSMLSFSSPVTVNFATNLPANSTNLAIPAGTLPTNQVFSAKVAFVTMTGGAVRSTETQFRMITGPMNPPAQPVLLGALIGNKNVAPGADVVGTLAAFSDLDAGDTETLSLPTLTFPEGNDNYRFMLDGRTIKLAGGTFTYNPMKPSYSILVRATDSYGLYSETAYTVSVQGTQTITFDDLTKTYGDAPFDLTATAPGGAVTYTSSNTGVATIEGSTVTIVGAGVAYIEASQAGGGAYLAAISVVKTLTVNKAAQTITGLASTGNKTYLDADYTLSVTQGASTSALTYASSAPSVATINSSGSVSIKGAGTAILTANQAADANYNAATQVSQTLTVNKAAQTITGLAATDSKTFGAGDYTLSVTQGSSTSGLIFSSSAPGVATIHPATGLVSIKGAGSATLRVQQLADANYNAAAQVSQTLTVNKATQTITGLASTDSKTFGAGDYTLSVTKGASSNGLIFASSAPGVATINSTTGLVSIKGAGTTTLTVNQVADANYNAASAVTQTLTVSPAGSTISVTGVTSFTYDGNPQGPSTSTKTGSTGAVTYVYAGTGYGPTNTKPTAAGSYTVTAGLASDANYSGATSSPATAFTIAPAASTISVTGTTSFTYDGNPQGPSTSSKSGSSGAVTYVYAGTGYGPTNTKPTAAGSYTVTAGLASDANYSGATSSPTAFEIGVKTLTIKAESNSRGYGAANPALTGSVESGAVFGESFEVTASTTATASSAPGSYSIVPDVTGSTLSNYTVSKINGSLTVTSAPFAGEDTLTAAPAPSTSTKYSFAQLLLNDSTYAGTLSITGVAAISGVTQGTVSTKGSWVVYVPKADATAGATDSFNYTLSNGTNMTMGRVTISLVSPNMTISVALASPPTVANGYKATFLVMPGLVFEAYGSDTVGGAYVKIGTTFTSASSGKLEVTDSAAEGVPSRFYKLKWLPGGAVSSPTL